MLGIFSEVLALDTLVNVSEQSLLNFGRQGKDCSVIVISNASSNFLLNNASHD